MVIRTCEHCQAQYDTYPSVRLRFCSHACASAAKAKGENRDCAQCGKSFYWRPSKPEQKFCSKSCARTAANLTIKNPSYHRDLTGENNPMYGKGFHGPDNPMYGKRKQRSPRWKGGRKIRKDGYILIVAPDDHPYPADYFPASGLKYILEHRRVMELHLGRYLSQDEVVHHIDGNPSNNDISNLQLFANQAEHIAIAHSGSE